MMNARKCEPRFSHSFRIPRRVVYIIGEKEGRGSRLGFLDNISIGVGER